MNPPDANQHRLRTWFLAIVAGCFVVFSMNFRELGLADTVPSTLLAASIVRDFDLTLDEFQPLLDEPGADPRTTLRRQMAWTSAILTERGHLRSLYPVGAAVLAAPVYAVRLAFGPLRHFADYRATAKTAAALIAALSAGFVFLALLRFTNRRTAACLALVYALGTSVWVIASQALWQHGPALLCLAIGVWAALRLAERDDRRDALVVSIAVAMTIVCRPQNLPASFAVFAFALATRPRRFLDLALPGAVIGGLLVGYNVHAFGKISGAYEAIYASPGHVWRGLTARTAFTGPLVEGLAGILVSPSRGLFVYSPVLAVGLVCLALASVKERLARFLLGWVVVTLVFYGKNRIWWGGTSYGPRYMTELSLPLILGLGMIWNRISERRAALVTVALLAAFGVLVQALGAFTWECGWHTSPTWIDFRPERLWDVRDPEIGRCLEVLETEGARGAEFGPFAPAKDRAPAFR